jgi:hypothetical protein
MNNTPRTDAERVKTEGDFYLDGFVEAEFAESLEADLVNLTDWKSGAMIVLSEWESVWEACGKPGHLGQSKAGAVLSMIKQTRTEAQ